MQPGARRGRERGHHISDHTADASIRAWAASPAGLLEEAAAALSALTVEIGHEVHPHTTWTTVEVSGRDLDGLVFAWLNELIGLVEVEHRAVAGTKVERCAPFADGWRLRARVALADYEPGRVQALRHAKAATMHGLRVVESAGRWSLEAVVDL